MKKIELFPLVGSFAENKDVARDVRTHQILPAIEEGDKVVLDFGGIDSATQSFIHALISDVIRTQGVEVLDRLYFENCTDTIQKIINIVAEYMQE